MKAHELLDVDWLKITDLENMFEIYQKQNGEYHYNLNETLYVDVPDEQLLDYTCDSRMHWPLISYKIYGTTRLAWLLTKLNKVQPEDMFRPKEPSETVKYLDPECVQTVVKNINDYGDY